jgi:hypothetical protein
MTDDSAGLKNDLKVKTFFHMFLRPVQEEPREALEKKADI